MTKWIKEKLTKAIVFALLFVLALILVYILVYTIFRALTQFNIISENISMLTGAISIVIAVLVDIWIIKCMNTVKKTKIENWLSLHYYQLVLWYVIIVILIGSLSAEVVWTLEQLKDLVSLEWTMLGLSVTIFLVWNMLMLKYLEDKKPPEITTDGWLDQHDHITEKKKFYQTASELFTTTTLLKINLLVVILATAIVYLVMGEIMLLRQTITIVGFLFSTNTLISLFNDFLKPLHEEKKSMLEANVVTGADIELQNRLSQQIQESLLLIESIGQLESIDDEEKMRIKLEILQKIKGETQKNPAE